MLQQPFEVIQNNRKYMFSSLCQVLWWVITRSSSFNPVQAPVRQDHHHCEFAVDTRRLDSQWPWCVGPMAGDEWGREAVWCLCGASVRALSTVLCCLWWQRHWSTFSGGNWCQTQACLPQVWACLSSFFKYLLFIYRNKAELQEDGEAEREWNLPSLAHTPNGCSSRDDAGLKPGRTTGIRGLKYWAILHCISSELEIWSGAAGTPAGTIGVLSF